MNRIEVDSRFIYKNNDQDQDIPDNCDFLSAN